MSGLLVIACVLLLLFVTVPHLVALAKDVSCALSAAPAPGGAAPVPTVTPIPVPPPTAFPASQVPANPVNTHCEIGPQAGGATAGGVGVAVLLVCLLYALGPARAVVPVRIMNR